MAKLVSEIYGEALFSLGQEKGSIDSLMEEITQLRQILKDNPDFSRLLNHPGIGRDERVKIMTEAFEGKISADMFGFLRVLLEKNRYGSIMSIFEWFENRYRVEKKIGVASVTSAVELSEEQKAAVEQRLLDTTEYEKMEINYQADETLIGGLVIRIGDRVVDSSIRTRLEAIQRQLLKVQM